MKFFTIRHMIELTGLSEYTIRGWEGRYSAFSPARTKSGRRMYKESDIRKALLLKELVSSGYRIKTLAHLTMNELNKLIIQDSSPALKSTDSIFIETCILEHRWDELRDFLSDKFRTRKPIDFLTHDIKLVLKVLSQGVNQGRFSIIQEHLVSAVLRQFIFSTSSQLTSKQKKYEKKSQIFLFTTVENDQHELGLLYCFALAGVYGYDCVYLGVNTPRQDLCQAALKIKADYVVISSIGVSKGHSDLEYINFLNRNLPRSCHFIFSGKISPEMQTLSIKRLTTMSHLDDFENWLQDRVETQLYR